MKSRSKQKTLRTSKLAALLWLSIATTVFSSNAAGEIFDMDAIRDPGTLEVKVLQDWDTVHGPIVTRQILVTINVGEIWPGQDYRVPVRIVVPADRKAKGFHLTGGNTPARLEQDAKPNPLDQELLKGGVGLVLTVVQEPGSYGERGLARAAETARYNPATVTELIYFNTGRLAFSCSPKP